VPINFCKLVSLRYEVQQVFAKGAGVERVFFPERSMNLPNRPALTFAILAPEQVFEDRDETWRMVESMTKENGASARTFKSTLSGAFRTSTMPFATKRERCWLGRMNASRFSLEKG
jgi:hypothetical protein